VRRRNTPPEIVERLNRRSTKILADAKAKARFTELGAFLLPGSPTDFYKTADERNREVGKVVKFAGARVD